MLKVLIVGLVFMVSGCSAIKSTVQSVNESVAKGADEVEKENRAKYLAEGPTRVVYTPLLKPRTPTNSDDIEILIRTPETSYRELGFISIYRKYPNETAADMLPFLRHRAAEVGAQAVLLMEIQEKPVGVTTRASSSQVDMDLGIVTVGGSSSQFIKEGTIRGVAIVYGK